MKGEILLNALTLTGHDIGSIWHLPLTPEREAFFVKRHRQGNRFRAELLRRLDYWDMICEHYPQTAEAVRRLMAHTDVARDVMKEGRGK